MPKRYKYYNPELVSTATRVTPLAIASRRLVDVPKAFSKISTVGDRLSVWCEKFIPAAEYSEYKLQAALGRRNHIQGIQRLDHHASLVMSGCSSDAQASHLFFAALPSRSDTLPWRSNCIYRNQPADADEILLTIGLNRNSTIKQAHRLTSKHWHAGGIANAGALLAVPVEGLLPEDGSKVLFFDTTYPEEPAVMKFSIDRPGKKAGAVALFAAESGELFAAVYYSEGERRKLDFYSFNRNQLHKSGITKTFTFDCTETLSEPGLTPDFGEYQCLQFVAQRDDRLYLVGFHNVGTAGHLGAPNVADLFEVRFDTGPPSSGAYLASEVRTLVKSATLRLQSDHNWFDMDAGAGLFIDQRGGISIHSCSGFKKRYSTRKYGINFCEFRPISSDFTPSVIDDPEEGWIDLFEHDSCGGRCIGLIGTRNTNLTNFSDIYVGGQMMNNQISSVRFQLPVGKTYTLYNDVSYRRTHGVLDLTGTGHVVTLSDLKINDFGDKASSGRYTA